MVLKRESFLSFSFRFERDTREHKHTHREHHHAAQCARRCFPRQSRRRRRIVLETFIHQTLPFQKATSGETTLAIVTCFRTRR